jgi:putative spermidine/putrescine transport system substrate-binding protein
VRREPAPRGEPGDDRGKKPADLTVLSWAGRWGSSLRETVSDPFAAEHGIRVNHRTHVGLKLPADLVEALRRGDRPPVDVVWCNSVPAFAAARAGWCADLDEEEELASGLAALDARARPRGLSGWPLVLAYVVHYVLVYRRDGLRGRRPDSWDVLMEPGLRGRIALYPGGNGFYPVAQVLGGGSVGDIPHAMDACWSYLRRLRPQVGTLDYSIGMSRLLAERRLDVCFRALPNALGFRDEGQDVGWSVPKEGITDTMDALWVPRGLPSGVSIWARRYIAHAISREVQERWCDRMGVLPVHPGAGLPGPFHEDPALPRSAGDLSRVLHVYEDVKADHQESWEKSFDVIFSSADSVPAS